MLIDLSPMNRTMGLKEPWKVPNIHVMDAKTQQDIQVELLYRKNWGHWWLRVRIIIHGSEVKKNTNGP